MTTDLSNSAGAVLEAPAPGITYVPAGTPLTRLSFFDGRFLRAEDLELEQRYTRELVSLSNIAGGAGVVHGFSVTRETGDQIAIDSGLAINRQGRVLFLPEAADFGIAELITRSTATATMDRASGSAGPVDACLVSTDPPVTESGESTVVWVLSIGPADMRCGEEVVHGRLCEDACTTGTAFDHRIDGLVFRMTPVQLDLPTNPAFGMAHLRSRIASAYFARERSRHLHLVSGGGLRSELWCRGAAQLPGEPPLPDSHVALAVIARTGAVTQAFDMWSARRERLAPPAMSYWQHRLNMRPIDVFLAQVLQFQCQLPSVLAGAPAIGDDAIDTIRRCVDDHAGETNGSIDEIVFLLTNALGGRRAMQPPMRWNDAGGRILTPDGSPSGLATAPDGPGTLGQGGLVDLPPTGLLPASVGQPVEPQMAALFGSGVDLRFCAAHPDAVSEEFWEAQHLDRIPLWVGLDDPDQRPEVDILVPDPKVSRAQSRPGASAYATRVTISPENDGSLARLQGVSRLRNRGALTRLAMAGIGEISTRESSSSTITHVRNFVAGAPDDVTRISSEEPDVIRRAPETIRSVRRIARAALSAEGGASTPTFEVDLDELRVLAGALDVSVGGDPFDGAIGDSFPISFEGTLGFPSERSRINTASFNGQLRINAVDRSGQAPKIDGVLTGIGRADDEEAEVSATVSVTVERTERATTLVAVARTQRDDDMPPMRLSIARQLAPEGLSGRLEVLVKDQWATLGTAKLEASRGVLVDGNEYHEAAETSIETISSIVKDPQKARDLGGFILGIDGQPSTTSTMVTTRDWVMFHRRRRIDCGQPAPVPAQPDVEPPEPTPARSSVGLGRMLTTSEERLAGVLALIDNGNLRLDDAAPVRDIEFITGTAAMTTPPRLVADLFDEVGAMGARVARVVYVGPPNAQRPGRIGEFANAFELDAADIATIDGDPVGLGFSQPNTTEVVVLVVAPKPIEERPVARAHRVWSTLESQDAILKVAKAVRAAGGSFLEVRRKLALTPLGTADFVGATLESHVLATDQSSNHAEHYVAFADDPTELEPSLVEARAGAIEPIIDRKIRGIQSVPWDTALAEPQWIVTLSVLR